MKEVTVEEDGSKRVREREKEREKVERREEPEKYTKGNKRYCPKLDRVTTKFTPDIVIE